MVDLNTSNPERLPSPIALRQPPVIVFPYDLDDEYSLLRTRNRSEAQLAEDFNDQDDELTVSYNPNALEVWPRCGIVWVDDEAVHYSEVETVSTLPPVMRRVEGLTVSEYQPISLGSLTSEVAINAVTVDELPDVDPSALFLGDRGFTLVGAVRVRGHRSLFTVRGSGRHGHGASFWFSDPSFIEVDLCSFDTVTLNLFLAPVALRARLEWACWKEYALDQFGSVARRVRKLKTLIRGYETTVSAFHQRGSWVRMYVLAEHHNLMANAVLELENLAGIDLSDDHASQDFRLRDLDDKCLESDECPAGVLYTTEEVDDCFQVRKLTYRTEITGTYTSVEIDFGDGTPRTSDLEGEHTYPLGTHFEPKLMLRNDVCIVESGLAATEELTVIQVAVPEIVTPELTCPAPPPTPTVPPPPPVTPPTPVQTVELRCPSLDIATITFPQWPQTITFLTPTFPPITVSANINFQTQVDVFVSVFHTFVITGPTATGPCFALVPCEGGTTGTIVT